VAGRDRRAPHGIFAGNPSLRRAVNFAVDRHALAAAFGYLGVKRTDQLLPPGVPGFIDAHRDWLLDARRFKAYPCV